MNASGNIRRQPRPRNLGEVLQAATRYLAGRNVYEPRPACELLASRILNCARLELYVRFDRKLTEAQLDAMRRGVRRLAAGEPVQYILGRVEFMDRWFKVDRRALIPRPETEDLVRAVLACGPLWERPAPAVVDVGTGSGCIILSIALARPQGRYAAVDISAEALALTRENATALQAANVAFHESDGLPAEMCDNSLDAVVANLPYVGETERGSLPSHIRDHEPATALFGGQDGLDVIRRIIPQTVRALAPTGFLFMEVGDGQAAAVIDLMRGAGFGDVVAMDDFAGRRRIVKGVKEA